MNIYLSDGGRDQIPGDLILQWRARSDLAPVPRTVEFTVNSKDGVAERLAVGNSIWTGYELLEYEIVKAKQEKIGGLVQDKDQIGGISVTALLKSCAPITYLRERAVVLERIKLGEVYRSCGATTAISDDFQLDRFSCLKGQVPSFMIAQALQEESAALVFRDGRLSVRRISDLLAQKPIDGIGQTDSTDASDSEFLERHNVPSFFSTNDDGATVMGDMSVARGVRFLPRTSERSLRNATRVLVVRRTVDADLAQQVQAGDVLDLNGIKMVVVTAVHTMEAKDGITETGSRFWMGGAAR